MAAGHEYPRCFPVRVVSPYRPFKPESESHIELGAFDWLGALAMLRASASYCGKAEVIALTDEKTKMKSPAFRYVPRCHRLMTWILDVSLAYIESDDFDRDTWFISPDMLLLKPLPRMPAAVDLMVLAHNEHLPIINHTQFWSYKAKDKLSDFFRMCLKRAEGLCEDQLRWGADTEPFINYLSPVPMDGGVEERCGLQVSFRPRREITFRVGPGALRKFTDWRDAPAPIAEFTYRRKANMAEYFKEIFSKDADFINRVEVRL